MKLTPPASVRYVCGATLLALTISAPAVTVEFDGSDIFRMFNSPADGQFQHEQQNPHQAWYYNTQGDIVNWGVSYADSLINEFRSPDPNAAYAQLDDFVTNPANMTRTTVINISLRPTLALVYGWGQDATFRDPPADWTTGDDAMAASLLSATAPSGWNSAVLWDPVAGPVVSWYTDNWLDPSSVYLGPDTPGTMFSFTADLLQDTDMDGIGDTEFGLGDDVRLYVGTGILFSNSPDIPQDISPGTFQYDSVVPATVSRVPCEPISGLLLAMGCGAVVWVRRLAGRK